MEERAVLRFHSCKAGETVIPEDEGVFVEYCIPTPLTFLESPELLGLCLLSRHPGLSTVSPADGSMMSGLAMFGRLLLFSL